jgi:O-antigen/teichoic acid export membrane protein
MVNVVVGGATGFLFWIVAARVAPAGSVGEAAALITAMFGGLQITQSGIAANVPMMLTSSPRPGWILKRAYLVTTALILVASTGYVLIAPRLASGLDYLSDLRLGLIFVVGSAVWGLFSLQDGALSGILKGHLVLLENTVWSILRLGAIVMLPLVVGVITPGWILATWLVPALLLVVVVNYYLFVPAAAPLRQSRGDHTHPLRQLMGHMGFETLTSVSTGVVNLALPAIVLTGVGAEAAAPFFAAYSFILVGEGALSSFTTAYGVEIRRNGAPDRAHTILTLRVLAVSSVLAIVAALLLGQQLMTLLGPEYERTGATVLVILALGLPFRSVTLLSGSINRVTGQGWKNAIQQGVFLVVSFSAILLLGTDSIQKVATALVLGRVAAAGISLLHLRPRIVSRSLRRGASAT